GHAGIHRVVGAAFDREGQAIGYNMWRSRPGQGTQQSPTGRRAPTGAKIESAYGEKFSWTGRVGIIAAGNVMHGGGVTTALGEGIKRRIYKTYHRLAIRKGLLVYERGVGRPQWSGATGPSRRARTAVVVRHENVVRR